MNASSKMTRPLFVASTDLPLERSSSWSPKRASGLSRSMSMRVADPPAETLVADAASPRRASYDGSSPGGTTPREEPVATPRSAPPVLPSPRTPRSLGRRLSALFQTSYVEIRLHRDVLRKDEPAVYLVPADQVSDKMMAVLAAAELASANEDTLFSTCGCKRDAVCVEHPPIDMQQKFEAIQTLAPELISAYDQNCSVMRLACKAKAHLPKAGAWTVYRRHTDQAVDDKRLVVRAFTLAMFL